MTQNEIRQVQDNQKNILLNRKLLIGINIAFVILMALITFTLKHQMHNCEEVLYEQLIEQGYDFSDGRVHKKEKHDES